MADHPMLTIKMLDDFLDSLPSEWTCPAGYTHRCNQFCFHPLPPEAQERLRKDALGLLARLRGTDG